jgi:hypothetical protein
MPTLRVDLQEGFSGDTVEIEIDGAPKVVKRFVTTRMQIGFADYITFDLAAGPHRLSLRMPERGATDSQTINLQQDAHVGVGLEGDKLVTKISDEEFRYL